jgi:hypothetical protein
MGRADIQDPELQLTALRSAPTDFWEGSIDLRRPVNEKGGACLAGCLVIDGFRCRDGRPRERN